jgi:peptidoglycan/LPS O-acetylase OafA/YrhL
MVPTVDHLAPTDARVGRLPGEAGFPASPVTAPAPAPAPSKTRKLDALTSLRFFAGMGLLVFHIAGSFDCYDHFWLNGLAWGQTVTFFFVLSGFILAYVYPKLENATQSDRFLLARIARIWPTHVVGFLLAIAFIPLALNIPHVVPVAVAHIFALQSWTISDSVIFAFNFPSWSISTELFFYLCFPFLIRSLTKNWRLALAGTLLLSLCCVPFCYFEKWPQLPDYAMTAPLYININPLCRLFEFALGVTTCLLYRKLWTSQAQSQSQNNSFKGTAIELAAIAAVVLALLLPTFWPSQAGLLGPFRVWMFYCGSAPAYALLILAMAFERGYLSRLLCAPALVHLGELSPSVYLFHVSIIALFVTQKHNLTDWPVWVTVCLIAVVSFLFGRVNFVLVENPCRKGILALADKFSNAKPKAAKASLSGKEKPRKHWLKTVPLIELLVLAALFMVVRGEARKEYNRFRFLDQSQVATLLQGSDAGLKDVQFGDQFRLLGVSEHTDRDGLHLDLAWQSLKKQRLEYVNAVHLLDTGGKIIDYQDYVQDDDKHKVEPGQIWHDSIRIQPDKLGGIAKIGLCIYSRPVVKLLPVDRGPRDSYNTRLLIDAKSKLNRS